MPSRRGSQRQLARRGPRAALTLAELLVVIAICAVLAGLILSGGWYARQSARVALCALNLHELGLAIGAYMNDYDSKLPLVYPLMPDRPRVWGPCPPAPPADHNAESVLRDYVSTRETFRCPVDHALRPDATWEEVGPGTWALIDPAHYEFNPHVSGMRVPPARRWAGPGKCLVMYDQICGGEMWYLHLRRYNALFSDGHVKAYAWIEPAPPAWNVQWPPD